MREPVGVEAPVRVSRPAFPSAPALETDPARVSLPTFASVPLGVIEPVRVAVKRVPEGAGRIAMVATSFVRLLEMAPAAGSSVFALSSRPERAIAAMLVASAARKSW
jgi:hypothetical protein